MLEHLFAGIATGFSETFGAPFLDGTVRWPGTPTMDKGGSIATPAVPVTSPCKVQVSAPTEAMRQAEGFMETDVRLLILAAGIGQPIDTSARISAAGITYRLLSATRDSGGIGWSCAARKA